eukprot:TRINITY_DN3700_c0_g1_i1.p1 TRINITY_DN3700_c0_g1~~TRINITY_DN3700_c0_g1_i1.p1  ORF type:complete len:507 (-),score=174.92 TRINITY_DN3700_c0_g1_i1:466-1947(-)
MAESLDRHLVFPLLEFLQIKGIYEPGQVMEGKIQLLAETNMVDFAMDIYKKLHNTDDAPANLADRREQVVVKLKELQTECAPILAVLEQTELVKELRTSKLFTAQNLEENYDVPPRAIQMLFSYAKFQFECGNYSGAAEYLFHFRALNFRPELNFSAMWGKLASEILIQNWETASEDMRKLKETIDNMEFRTPLEQLQQRTWLIHWSLFVFFNHPDGRNGIIDMFFEEKYLNAIQTNCPHILRYLTTAVITNKRRRNVLKDLVKVIQQEHYTYRDPITEFLECLYVKFDFDQAQLRLQECEKLLTNDFFLVALRDDFIENARMFIFETYCRIHQKIDIAMLASKLDMSEEHAERWIVNLIRNARLDAKIDSENNHVVMSAQFSTVYQQIIEKTKGLSFRSNVLANHIDKRVQQLRRGHEKRENRQKMKRENKAAQADDEFELDDDGAVVVDDDIDDDAADGSASGANGKGKGDIDAANPLAAAPVAAVAVAGK